MIGKQHASHRGERPVLKGLKISECWVKVFVSLFNEKPLQVLLMFATKLISTGILQIFNLKHVSAALGLAENPYNNTQAHTL